MIAELRLQLDAAAIEPGDPITGTVRWSAAVESLDVQLFWRTTGKGDTDEAMVARAPVAFRRDAWEARFALTAPEEPLSFSGTLISLAYYVRVEDSTGGHVEAEIVIGPGGKEIRFAGDIVDD